MSVWHRIVLDKEHCKCFGVCSGIARSFGYSRLSVRVVTLIAIFFAPLITLTAYATALILLPTRVSSHKN